MDYMKKNHQIANSFYNLGLKKAKARDLTGAADCLKKSLRFDKYQMDARNLLGLIFYEVGETANALVQWVISMNLRAQDNPASHYVEEIQKNAGLFEREGLMLKTYNQALQQAKSDNGDLAVLQLAKALEDNPRFVKGHVLLALLYISRADYGKAGNCLTLALEIDKNDPKAQRYMAVVRENTRQEIKKEEVEPPKPDNTFSHRKMEDDDIIVPPEYKENTGWGSILNIIAGLVIGMLVVYFLVMPAKTKSLNTAHNQELLSYSQQIDGLNQQLSDKTKEYDELKASSDEMEAQLASLEANNQAVLAQYQAIIQVLDAYRNDDLIMVAQLYGTLDTSLIADEGVLAIANQIVQDMTTTGYQTLVTMGTSAWNGGNLQRALEYYQKSLEIKPDNTSAMYLLGRLYQDLGNIEESNVWFDKIVNEYPNSSQAEQARYARGY